MFAEIEDKIKITMKRLKEMNYDVENVSTKELYDYMTGETFSGDKTTLREVLNSEYLMIHEVAEISELKKMGRKIDKRVIVDSPKAVIYKAHFFAQELEMDYAFKKKDYTWLKLRIGHHKLVLLDDPNLPENLKPRAQEIYDKFKKFENSTPNP